MKENRGRRKGSVSFVTVTLGQLNSILKEGANVPVSRLWAEGFGLSGEPIVSTAKGMAALKEPKKELKPEPKPEAKQVEDESINFIKNQW